MTTDMYLDFDAFIRSVKQNRDINHGVLLGAGASITSGIQSANDCIWEWKRDIYTSQNPDALPKFKYYRVETTQNAIQKWLDNQGGYPALGSPEEYSFYAEKAYPIAEDRRKYFQRLCDDKAPYIGYKLLCMLAKKEIVKSVWTTNFDGLTERAAHNLTITPINVNLDDSDRIFRAIGKNELLYVALHGDYKYSSLKNTDKELDTQDETFIDTLQRYFTDRNLIVVGYSGRDKSLMDALKKAYSVKGSGRLYWCGFGDQITEDVKELINIARHNGREAYYVISDGFDKTMVGLSKACLEDSPEHLTEIDAILQSVAKGEDSITPFSVNGIKNDKYLKSNLHPVSFPKEVYQFEVSSTDKSLWKIIEEKNNDEVVAIPFKGKIYAISTLTKINETFGDILSSDIIREPIYVKDIKSVGVFQRLMLKTILLSLSKLKGLNTDGRHKLWKKEIKKTLSTDKGIFNVYEALDIHLHFNKELKYAFVSLKPTIYIDDNKQLPIEYRLTETRTYFDTLRNKQYDEVLESWNTLLFQNSKIRFSFPLNSGSDMSFIISPNTAIAGVKVLDTNFRGYTANIDDARIVYNGVQLLEPQLEFLNKDNPAHISKDFHPMRGLLNHRPYDYLEGGIIFPKDVKLCVICPSKYSGQLFSFLQGLKVESKATVNPDYIIDYPGFESIYNLPIDIPNVGSEKWEDINIDIAKEKDFKSAAYSLGREIVQKVGKLGEAFPSSSIVVFIPQEWEALRGFEDNGEVFDLHDYIKAFAAEKSISTQLIEETTLGDSLKCQIYWWLSLSFYVKAQRTPWLLSNIDKDTAFAGIGYSVKKKKGKTEIVLGCSHIYDSNGQGLKYKLSRVKDYTLDRKNNPYLSYDEAYQFGISIVDLFMSSMGYIPSRVVVHKRTDFKEDEINGIKDSLSRAGVNNIDLVTINFEQDLKFFATRVNHGNIEIDNFPLSRGTVLLTEPHKALLWTHGIVPSVKGSNRSYYLGGRSIPSPILVTKFYGKSDINTLASEILGLTKMNWNSFDLYTKLPSTIDSSNRIAKIGKLLSRYEGKSYDYRYFI